MNTPLKHKSFTSQFDDLQVGLLGLLCNSIPRGGAFMQVGRVGTLGPLKNVDIIWKPIKDVLTLI